MLAYHIINEDANCPFLLVYVGFMASEDETVRIYTTHLQILVKGSR
jgi:hypothetical protein